MKFSIIVPVYNSEQYLHRLANSILNQSYKDFELILVDDASTDSSFDIMEKLGEQDNRIKIHRNEQNRGPGLTRRTGFEISTGELLFFVDSDDYLYDNNVLSKIIEIYNSNNFEILLFDYIFISGDITQRKNSFLYNQYKTGEHSIDKFNGAIVEGGLWRKIFLSSKMKSEYFYDANNFEDYYTTYCYFNNCETFYYSDAILYVSDKNNEYSLTNTMSSEKIEIAVDVIKKMIDNSKLKKSVRLLAMHYFLHANSFSKSLNVDEVQQRKNTIKISELKAIFPGYFNRNYFLRKLNRYDRKSFKCMLRR